MKAGKKIFIAMLAAVLVIAFLPASAMAATPRTMLTYEVWGYTPSDLIDLKAKITVNDSENIIVGTQGITDYAWSPTVKQETISWTSLNIAYNGSYAYCAVSYTTIFGKTYTETVCFYP